jgi:endonuclease/exonuclease/phosphatase family metal-dependent hydrolase
MIQRIDSPSERSRRAGSGMPEAGGVSGTLVADGVLAAPTSQSRQRGHRLRAARRLLWAATVFVLVAAFVYWQGSTKRPTGAASGARLNQAPGMTAVDSDSDTSQRTFRVANFNIHGGRGPDGRLDLARTAEQLAGFDLIGLNEVRGTRWRTSVDQAQQLGEELDLAWLFAPTERRWGRDDFGNGLLAWRANVRWQRMPLPKPSSRTNRNFVWARLPVGDVTVNVLVTHLERGDTAERHLQLQSLGDLFLSLAGPAILMGDLNSTADDPQLRELLAAPGVSDALSQRGIESPHRIDWMLVRGLNVLDAGLIDRGASDHPLAWAELEVP